MLHHTCTLLSVVALLATGNTLPHESENVANAAQVEESVDNEVPLRYDGAQLWRIYRNETDLLHVIQTLEDAYDGVLWKEDAAYWDVSISRDHLQAAHNFLVQHKITSEVLNDNVQNLMDQEKVSAPYGRAKRAIGGVINWRDYHDLDVIYSYMRDIRGQYPDITRLYTIGKTSEGRDLKVLRISENPREYKKIWIDGGIHAREWISPATVTYILHQIMTDWHNQPAYIKEKTWYIMPVMNPDGYVYSRKVNRLWRKNRAPAAGSKCFGVDLNRNFDIGWTSRGSSTNPCSDTYRGTEAASELETKAVTEFLKKRKYNLESYLTFHSYGQLVVYPWAYKAVKVRDAGDLQRVANLAVQRIEKETGTSYRASVTYAVLGVAGGGSDDWSRAALGTKYVYTVELRDTGNYGFVLPPNQIEETALEGFTVVKTVAQAIK